MSVISRHFAVLMCKVTEIYYTESWKGILSLEVVKLESSPFFHTVVYPIRPLSHKPKDLSTIKFW